LEKTNDGVRQVRAFSNQTVQPVPQSDIDVFVVGLDGTEVFVCIVIGHISSRDIKLHDIFLERTLLALRDCGTP
jgi:hypothetical protein